MCQKRHQKKVLRHRLYALWNNILFWKEKAGSPESKKQIAASEREAAQIKMELAELGVKK